MIEGRVNANGEATIRLVLRGYAGEEQTVEAIIDTGFTGYLTLPAALIDRLGLSWAGRAQALLADGSLHVFDMYIGTVMWNGQYRTIEVDEADTEPLTGMGLLRGRSLRVDVVEDGTVRSEALASFSGVGTRY